MFGFVNISLLSGFVQKCFFLSEDSVIGYCDFRVSVLAVEKWQIIFLKVKLKNYRNNTNIYKR